MKTVEYPDQHANPLRNRLKRTISALATEILTLLGIAYVILSLLTTQH